MPNESRFSDRHNYSPKDREIKVREDAPPRLRGVIIQLAEEAGLRPTTLRDITCRVLREIPDPSNWSEYPNIDSEVKSLIQSCDWYYVYDIAEAIYRILLQNGKATHFQDELNAFFHSTGIGWQMSDGTIETRGSEAFESSVHNAVEALSLTARPTASREIHEALQDLSRRPHPDVTGSIQHAMAALECVARDVSGDPKSTLGELLRRYPDLLPKPLDEVVSKAWGYASEMARHVREGRTPTRAEAELIVGLAATMSTYLAKRSSG